MAEQRIQKVLSDQGVCSRRAAEKFKYIFPVFCIFGSLAAIDLVWTIQDIALGLLTLPNLLALIVLWPQVRKASREFWSKKQAA